MTRAADAERHGITVAALDGYCRRARRESASFVEIAIAGQPSRDTFAIAIANDRRIKISWADIERAARHAGRLQTGIEALDGQQPFLARVL